MTLDTPQEFGAAELMPSPDTAVLVNRPVDPKRARLILSTFTDDYWHFTPAVWELHERPIGVNFADIPAQYKLAIKLYVWLQLNHEDPPRLRRAGSSRLSVRSIALGFRSLRPFLNWLTARGIDCLCDVTVRDLDAYLDDVIHGTQTVKQRQDLLIEVRRLWSYRNLLPAEARLPTAPPWDGEEIRDLVGPQPYDEENRTPRIPEGTMTPLLTWAIRFVENFADDIVAAHRMYLHLCSRRPDAWRVGRSSSLPDRSVRKVRDELVALIERYRCEGSPLPGKHDAKGALSVDHNHLARLLNCHPPNVYHHTKRGGLLDPAVVRLPIGDGAFVHSRVAGTLDGSPWREHPITYAEAPQMARLLSTACYIVVTYLSGMRPGEALNLVRGCAVHDTLTGLDYIVGKEWKGAVNADGSKKADGQERDLPWTVVPVVLQAVHILERLHDSPLLFPATLYIDGRAEASIMGTRQGKARTTAGITKDISGFITWVGAYCAERLRDDAIPPDRTSALISPSRFRRTLAWFIWRRPRGAVATALQYGHVNVRITQGYGGTAASGFPDVSAFEEFLAHVVQLMADERRMSEGEHVSGPAAAALRDRLRTTRARFAGHIIHTARQAREALGQPCLQVYHARAVTCVFDPGKALCQVRAAHDDARRTPDLDNCHPNCQNLARTDRDVDELCHLHAVCIAEAEDPLTPEPRRIRAKARTDAMARLIEQHNATRPEHASGGQDDA